LSLFVIALSLTHRGDDAVLDASLSMPRRQALWIHSAEIVECRANWTTAGTPDRSDGMKPEFGEPCKSHEGIRPQ
jgi:hypothetical protein